MNLTHFWASCISPCLITLDSQSLNRDPDPLGYVTTRDCHGARVWPCHHKHKCGVQE